jgi:broad specificity phosphatase PhoE/thiamine kinase-like enzyme
MEKYLIFIRHGQSEGNVVGDREKIIKGRGDDSQLTVYGKEQVKKAASVLHQKLAKKSIIIFSSPKKRTRQTAEIIAGFLPKSKIILDERLLDIDFGLLEGKKWEEVDSQFSRWRKKFKEDRMSTPFPGGESFFDLQQRLLDFLNDKIEKDDSRYFIIVTHEAVIKAVVDYFSSVKVNWRFYQIDNASISLLYFGKKERFFYQIGGNEFYLLPKRKSFLKLISFYRAKNMFYLQIKPQKSYSFNQVATVTLNDKKYLIKFIPNEFLQDYRKEKLIFEKIANFLPVPKIIAEEKNNEGIFLMRTFIEGKIANWYLKRKNWKEATIEIWAKLLRKISQIKVNIEIGPGDWKKFVSNWIEADLTVLQKIGVGRYQTIKNFYQKNFNLIETNKIVFLHNDLSCFNFALMEKKEKLSLAGVWDFERALIGDSAWDLAVVFKICFYPKRKDVFFKFLSFYDKNYSQVFLKKIYFYLLMNITGAIRYRYQRGRSIKKELKNLEIFLKLSKKHKV